MNKKFEQLKETIKNEMTMMLATESNHQITMRTISPVLYNDTILFFTGASSNKYKQLKENNKCCVSIGSFMVQAEAIFKGGCMLDENEELRRVYDAKFPGAFDEGMEFGGRFSEFIILKPTIVSGWSFPNDIQTEDGIPTIPFEFEVK